MADDWTSSIIRQLLDRQACPRCRKRVSSDVCASCGAELGGERGWEVLNLSREAADVLSRREAAIAALPTRANAGVPATPAAAPPTQVAAPSTPTAAPAAPAAAPPTAPAQNPALATAPRPDSRSGRLSLQSVLAVAGAGLVAVAGIVFTFFNPDLTDIGLRSAIIAALSVAFVVTALLLARRQLGFSAEAVGALGAVFVALDVQSLTELADEPGPRWALAALGTLVGAAGLVALGVAARIRSWVWVGLAAAPPVPLFAALSIDETWWHVAGAVVGSAVALAVRPLVNRLSPRFDSPMRADQGTAMVMQLILGALAVVTASLQPEERTAHALGVAAVLAVLAALSAASTRQEAREWWSAAAGGLAASSLAVAALAIPVDQAWPLALAALGPVVIAIAVPLTGRLGSLSRPHVGIGVAVVAGLLAVPLGTIAAITVRMGLLGERGVPDEEAVGWASVAGLAACALALALLRRAVPFAVWLVGLAVLTSALSAALPTIAQAAVLIAVAIGGGVASRWTPLRARRLAVRAPALVTAHAALLAAVIVGSREDVAIRLTLGGGVILGIVAIALALPRTARPYYTAAGYAWALWLVADGLDATPLTTIAVLCLTTAVAALAALVVTVAPWPRAAHWYAILAVTSVPFLIGVGSVVAERSGWTGMSTSVMVALALVITATRRAGLTRWLRTIAAAIVIPALAVVVISFGAEFLASSASPVTLPVIAAIVACLLPAARLASAALASHGVAEPDARSVGMAVEVSALVTAAVAVALGLAREAAGLPTTLTVLVILGAGGVATALVGRRTYGWVVAGVAFTGALWCVWGLAGVVGLEPYLLPPTLGAAIVGGVLTVLGRRGYGLSAPALFATGVSTAVAPVLVALAALGSDDAPWPWRTVLLLGLSAALLAIALLGSRVARVAPLRTPAAVLAVVAAAAGSVQAVRYGLSLDGALEDDPGVVLLALGFSVAAALLAAVGGVLLNAVRASRWVLVPSLLFLAVGPIVAMRAGWLPILTLYALSLALLVVMIATALRARRGATVLPPVPVTFAVAWATAVASWSARDLRVEAFSLPMGVALIVVGIIGMSAPAADRPRFWAWPIGFRGSWALLGPGIVVTLLPSILATGTDPRTERAILVIVLALVAILIGNLRKLAAPFILGIIALPIENIVVFSVQIGRNIGAVPWWITLATAGAVLLVLAVSTERRVGADKGAAARLRDLT